MWLSPEFLHWHTFVQDRLNNAGADWERAYKIWAHAEEILEQHDDELDLVDAVTTLKRAMNHRLQFLKDTYSFKTIPVKSKPQRTIEQLAFWGIVRPTVIVGRGIPSPTATSRFAPDMRPFGFAQGILSHSSGSLPHEPLSLALYWDALTSTELDTRAFGVGRLSGLQSACASAIRPRPRLLRCPLMQQPHVSLSDGFPIGLCFLGYPPPSGHPA